MLYPYYFGSSEYFHSQFLFCLLSQTEKKEQTLSQVTNMLIHACKARTRATFCLLLFPRLTFNCPRLAKMPQVVLAVKNLPASAGDVRDRTDYWVGQTPRAGHGNPLQYSCLEIPRGQSSLADYSPRGPKEVDMTEVRWHACMHC